MTSAHITNSVTPKARRAFWFRDLREQGFDALSAWNGARARIRLFDGINREGIEKFVSDCLADGVECSFEEAASILEDRVA